MSSMCFTVPPFSLLCCAFSYDFWDFLLERNLCCIQSNDEATHSHLHVLGNDVSNPMAGSKVDLSCTLYIPELWSHMGYQNFRCMLNCRSLHSLASQLLLSVASLIKMSKMSVENLNNSMHVGNLKPCNVISKEALVNSQNFDTRWDGYSIY